MIIYYLYIVLTIIILPLYIILLFARLMSGKETFKSIVDRFALGSYIKGDKEVIWLHGASVGESMAALTLIETINSKNKNYNILVTTGTIAAANILKKWLPSNAVHKFVPIDNYFLVKYFLHKIKPSKAIFIESELWPCLVIEASKYCKTYLVNARLSDKSYRLWKKYSFLFKIITNNYDLIIAQSERDKEKYITASASTKVINLGNLKFSNKELEADLKYAEHFKNAMNNKHIFVAASTHFADEEVVVRAITNLKSKNTNLFSVIILRHPNRLSELTNICNKFGLTYSVKSEQNMPDFTKDVFIVNTFGELGTFYYMADIVFVGGSFKKGGHNLLEPAYFNCAIIVGPDMSHFMDITKTMLAQKAILQIENYEQLANKIVWLIEHKDECLRMASLASMYRESMKEVKENYYMTIFADKS